MDANGEACRMPKNNYAVVLAAKKQAERAEWMRYAIDKTLDFVTIALNEEYHFGPERLNRLSRRVNELWDEYGELVKDGYDYADDVIKRRLEQIVGKDDAD
jgi:hypothetical protein